MWAAAEKGDAKKVAKLMRHYYGFDVNGHDGYGSTLLHYVCVGDGRSPVIPLLLAHPDIDVNVRFRNGSTPFLFGLYLWTHLLCS